MMGFLKWTGDSLQDLLLIFGPGILVLCNRSDVCFEIFTHVFPRLQTLGQKASCARGISVGLGLVVGVGHRLRSGREVRRGHDGVVRWGRSIVLRYCH